MPGREAVNAVVALDLAAGGAGEVLVDPVATSAAILRSAPTVPGWLGWRGIIRTCPGTRPSCGWRTCLPMARSDAPRMIAGGRGESVFQPEWSPDGVLYFVSDRSGWWNLYRWRGGQREALAPMQAEFGVPAWSLGARTYAFESADSAHLPVRGGGPHAAGGVGHSEQAADPDRDPLCGGGARRHQRCPRAGGDGGRGSLTFPVACLSLNPDSGEVTRLRQSRELTVDAGCLSAPRPIAFETTDGQTAHAFYYPPCNRDYEGPPGERPPLLVKSHGGPTGAASAALSLDIQFWTSRGIAVVDVNYGGSTGYGTASTAAGSTAAGGSWTWTTASTPRGTWCAPARSTATACW